MPTTAPTVVPDRPEPGSRWPKCDNAATMSSRRRNVVSLRAAPFVAAAAVGAGVAAAVAGCEPTGQRFADAAICFAVAAFVTWASATTPWWALVVASGITAVASSTTPLILLIPIICGAAAAWIGAREANLAAIRALTAGSLLQVLLRLEWDPFFAASALLTAGVGALLVFTAINRRPTEVRSRIARYAKVLGAGVGVALFGIVVAATFAGSPGVDGYDRLTEGLDLLRNGDSLAAAAKLREASDHFDEAGDQLTKPWALPARAVPVLAQHQASLSAVFERTSAALDDAAAALDYINVDQLRVVDGVVDVEAIALLAAPIDALQNSVDELIASLEAERSPWLLWPVQHRFDGVNAQFAEISRQSETARTAVAVGPAMLGLDEPRRWLVAFTSPAEVRGQTGLMGNWAELTTEAGRLFLSAQGRTNDLSTGIVENAPVPIDASSEFFDRYGPYGAGTAETTVRPKFWSNVTMSPDTPTVAAVMAQMYEAGTGRSIDGVFIVDPAGIAAMLDVTGPITLVDQGLVLTDNNAEQFLLVDQYERPESEREDLLEAATTAMVSKALASDLPGPQVLGSALGAVARSGHLSGFATRPEEQRLFELLGMNSALPALGGHDGLAIVANNAAGNKIDSFARREVRYQGVHDARSGRIDAEVSITLDNTAPAQGYPDYVISNLIDAPKGTNRTLLSVYTPLQVAAASIDGRPVAFSTDSELGWNVYTVTVELAARTAATITFSLGGVLEPGDYRLALRPQPLATPERFRIEIENARGAVQAGLVGTLNSSALLDSSGLSRPGEN